MADVRYFRVEKDTSIPRAYRAVRDNSGTTYDYETEGIAYDAGSYVASTSIDPRVIERYDDGDEHLNSLLTEVDENEVEENAAEVRAAAQLVRSPEHTVEAYVLGRDEDEPYELLSEEETLELKSAGADEAREIQEATKEAAGDEVQGVDPDEGSAIDYATAKAEADKEAGKSLPVSESPKVGEASEKKSAKKGRAKKAAAENKVAKQPNQANVDAAAKAEENN
jgi:hypothetical protein